jgi:hypothetical protein
MKKLSAILILGVILVFTFTGCGQDALVKSTSATTATDASGNTEKTAETESKKVSKDDYDKNLNGLAKYFNDLGYLSTDNKTEMQADLIGAKSGNRYTKDTVTVELYQFDTKKTNDTVEAVKKDGKFTIYEKEVEAYVSDNGKYLMIYSDTAVTDDTTTDAYKTKQSAIKAFKEFE